MYLDTLTPKSHNYSTIIFLHEKLIKFLYDYLYEQEKKSLERENDCWRKLNKNSSYSKLCNIYKRLSASFTFRVGNIELTRNEREGD